MLRYAITPGAVNDEAHKNSSAALVARCAELARDGVDYVLVREKQLPAGELARIVRSIVAAVRQAGSQTRVLVAQRVDVAIAVAADGVHLSARAGELTVAQARQVMPKVFVSVSCHSIEEIERARDSGASAALFAPVFGKMANGVEVVAGVGLHRLREACLAAGTMPVFALGGVTGANTAQCVEAGASGVAGIRLFGF